VAAKDVVAPTPFVLDTKASDDARARNLQTRRLAIQSSIDRALRQKQFAQEELELQKLQTKLNDLNRDVGSATARDEALDVTPDDGGQSKLRFKRKIDSDLQDHRIRDNERRQFPLLVTDDKGKGSASNEALVLPRQSVCPEIVSFSRQWQSEMVPVPQYEEGYDASFRTAGGTRLDISKVKWLENKYGPMHRQIFEPYLDEIRSLDANTSKCRIRIIINGNKTDKAYIAVHNVFVTLMIIVGKANSYFLTIHDIYDTDDRMPTSPDWYDATFEQEGMLQPFLDAWVKNGIRLDAA
jgi:hypothetical protein